MMSHQTSRRTFLAATCTAGVLSSQVGKLTAQVAQGTPAAKADTAHLPIATNTYPWLTFARRDKAVFEPHTVQLLRDIAATGIGGYEPIIESVAELAGLEQRLQAHQLQMHSIYVNSVLHDADRVEESIAQVLEIAAAASGLGTKIVVTNPSPIRWGGPEDKSDAQLTLQAQSLDRLGGELRSRGMELAYHNHDAELRQGAREFHHMLTATDPDNVRFCLDAHWIFRGCGNSQVAVMDALELYHSRVVELHLRQSQAGIWSDVFSMQGDIDYARIFEKLARWQTPPHLVLEQSVETGSPSGRTVVEAHRASYQQLAAYRRSTLRVEE